LAYFLVIEYWKGLGILLQLTCHNRSTNRGRFCKYAVGDASLLDRFEEQDDLQFPTGCFLAPSHAWLAVEDFLNSPEKPSPRVEWVDDGDIPWPENRS
jgi:hypothetical protein